MKTKGERLNWKKVSETKIDKPIKLNLVKRSLVELEQARRKGYNYLIP